jgi:FMN-dependent NADH-azoreductase
LNAGKEMSKTISESNKQGKQVSFQQNSPMTNITDMNINLKNLAELSQNNIDGLANLDAIKNLQHFNMEGYNQAINNLKRQIVQYQK